MSTTAPPAGFAFASPHAALQALIDQTQPVDEVQLPMQQAFGRVLSQPIRADRDSPPHDVSAMDGYAVREHAAIAGATLAIADESCIGHAPPPMPARGCLNISTGACVPAGCDGIIPREHVVELPGQIQLHEDGSFTLGQHIRRRGENTRQGEIVVPAACAITAPIAAALAAFGYDSVVVYRAVRVAIITTGNELLPVHAQPQPWQIRDSNTATLLAGLANRPWIDVVAAQQVEDQRERVAAALRDAATQADLIITTGGVSMGDHDYLKPALLDLGGQVIYHKLPIRPGKPTLGGLVPDAGERGRHVPILALPGNPVAVAVALPMLVGPLIRSLAGFQQSTPTPQHVTLINPPAKPLGLWRYLPARRCNLAQAQALDTRGSGDLAGTALAEGYVQMPPDAEGPGPWVFYDASL